MTPCAIHAQTMANNPTLFSIGNENISADEFVKVYTKNNLAKDADFSYKSLSDYENLYINFRLKVKDARDMNLDTTTAVTNELKTYRSQLAKSYLVDKDMLDKMAQDEYNRMQTEIHIRHILIKCNENACPKDTLKAYNKLNNIRNLITKGKLSFDAAAKDSSDDPQAKENSGDLGFLTAMQISDNTFENNMYNTPVGKISKVFRTQYGYHIIEVIATRPSTGTTTVEHIFIRTSKTANTDELKSAAAKINDIYTKLTNGESFEDLAKNYSDDKTSASQGGKLAPFTTGKMMPDFDMQVSALTKIGDYTKPFQTKMGWHIVKLLDRQPLPAYDKMKDQIKKNIEKEHTRYAIVQNSLISQLKKDYNISENIDNKKSFYTLLDTLILNGVWKASDDIKKNKSVLISLTDKTYKPETHTYTMSDFGTWIETNQRTYLGMCDMSSMYEKMYQGFVNAMVLDFESNRLEYKYTTFKDLMNEYMDGILLFDLMDQKVWGRAVKDTAGLNAFYETIKQNYLGDETANIQTRFYKTAKDQAAYNKLKAKGMSDEAIGAKLNKKILGSFTVSNDVINHSEFVPGEYEWKAGSTYTGTDSLGITVYTVVSINAPQPKPLEEVKGYVVAQYQDYLEKNWLDELKKKYPVHKNDEVLKTLVK